MQAPIYPPATAYVAPAARPFVFGIDMISVKEAVASAPIKEIMLEEAPQMKFILQAAQVQTHVSNWSVWSLRTIDLISDAALAKIEARIAALPASARPAL